MHNFVRYLLDILLDILLYKYLLDKYLVISLERVFF